MARLAALGFDDLAMTTNGVLLADNAEQLVAVGTPAGERQLRLAAGRPVRTRSVGGVTSTSSSRPWTRPRPPGSSPLKVNVVLFRGRNDDEILDFAAFARDTGRIVRFIEFMPLDAEGRWGRSQVVPGREVFDRVSAVWPLETVDGRPRLGAGRALPVRRRARGDRTHLQRHPTILRDLQPTAADR